MRIMEYYLQVCVYNESDFKMCNEKSRLPFI